MTINKADRQDVQREIEEIKGILFTYTGVWDEPIRIKIATAIYEAGYRKQAEPKEAEELGKKVGKAMGSFGKPKEIGKLEHIKADSIDIQDNDDLFNLIIEQRWTINGLIEAINELRRG